MFIKAVYLMSVKRSEALSCGYIAPPRLMIRVSCLPRFAILFLVDNFEFMNWLADVCANIEVSLPIDPPPLTADQKVYVSLRLPSVKGKPSYLNRNCSQGTVQIWHTFQCIVS